MDNRLFGNRIPLFAREGFIICFEALPEDGGARYHFIHECGWSKKEFSQIENTPFFCAHVSAWKNGEMLGDEYLGCCSYVNISDFYAEKGGYFEDMVASAIGQAKQAESARASKAEAR